MNSHVSTGPFILILIGLLYGCQFLPSSESPIESTDTITTSTPLTDEKQEPILSTQPQQAPGDLSREEIIEIGTDRYIAERIPALGANAEADEDGITLNFQGTEIQEFVKAVLGDVLGENYIIDPSISGQVNLQTAKPIPVTDLFSLFEDILDMNNAAVIKNNNMYQIIPKNQAIRGNLSPSSVTHQQGYNLRIIPLRYIAALEMQKILEPYLADGSDLRIDNRRNLIIISGTAGEIDTIQQTIDIFDVDWLRGMSVGLYPLTYVNPVTMKDELDSIINGLGGGEGGDSLGGLVRTVPLERLNSILLIGATAAALREVEIWMRRLDKPGDFTGKHLYVYNVQNAKATDLADILGHIFMGRSRTTDSDPVMPELAPGLEPVQITSPNTTGASPFDSPPQSQGNLYNPTGSIAIGQGNSIDIIADDDRNALLILASQQEYQMVEAAIRKLDIVPLQVLIEASILEVTLSDNLNYGIEWFFNNRIDATHLGLGRLDTGEGGISALTPAFSYTVVNNANNVKLALNALAEVSTIKVLSSPSLMVLDNKTATINIGDEIPVPTRQTISTIDPNAPSINEIQFRKTGVTLTVTPRVNQGGLVTMAVRQEVSSAVGTTSSNIDAPTIQQRQIESEVAINSGDTIVLGGLIQDTNTNGNSGIPGLRNLPIIGNFFSQNINESRRTELLVLITPRVVRNRNEARDITEEFRKKLQGLTPPSAPGT